MTCVALVPAYLVEHHHLGELAHNGEHCQAGVLDLGELQPLLLRLGLLVETLGALQCTNRNRNDGINIDIDNNFTASVSSTYIVPTPPGASQQCDQTTTAPSRLISRSQRLDVAAV